MGTAEDLGYLSSLLEKNGCSVLRSISNENTKSLNGLKTGGESLASEIVDLIGKNSQLRRISVVGNSLGGLYSRYAMQLLFNDSDQTIAGLQPHRFMSIATPHLGVRNWTFVDDFGLSAPDIVKRLVSRTMLSTGRDIFSIQEEYDGKEPKETLLSRMATEETFLSPLRSFSSRRLYANLQKDFVVPLGTAAFMDDFSVKKLREKHGRTSGIVSLLKTDKIENTSDRQINLSNTDKMIGNLDGLGWEKVIVNFPGLLPIAHNKICALTREPKWLYENVLGFNAGKFVMEDASKWLSD
jgi:hypothetical protein